jgi:hypothetical protein
MQRHFIFLVSPRDHSVKTLQLSFSFHLCDSLLGARLHVRPSLVLFIYLLKFTLEPLVPTPCTSKNAPIFFQQPPGVIIINPVLAQKQYHCPVGAHMKTVVLRAEKRENRRLCCSLRQLTMLWPFLLAFYITGLCTSRRVYY